MANLSWYAGSLSCGQAEAPLRFGVGMKADGELRFFVPKLPYSPEVSALQDAWEDEGGVVPFFTLKGEGRDGTRFHSDHITISRFGHKMTPTSAHVTLSLKCAKGIITRVPKGGGARPFVRYLLRGFEAFPPLRAETPLGEVLMAGKYPLPKRDRLSGYVQVTPADGVADLAAWRTQAEALCEHLRLYMSFALSRPVPAPVEEVWDGRVFETTSWSRSRTRRNSQPVFHPMRLQEFLLPVANAYSAPPIIARNVAYLIEWFSMDAGYTETRLTNAMTALENLIDSNLGAQDKQLLRKAAFNRAAKAMRRSAGELLGSSEEGAEAFLQALPAKLQDLNRRPFYDKLMILADRWGVPIGDLPSDAIKRAIGARNTIVHRGYYYEPAPDTPEGRDLWDHVYLMREIVVRFVLTIVGFSGVYLSFDGGQHDVTFPPPLSSGQ